MDEFLKGSHPTEGPGSPLETGQEPRAKSVRGQRLLVAREDPDLDF